MGLAVAWELLNRGLAVELIDPDLDQASARACDRSNGSLAALGVLRETQVGKEKLFIHPKLMQLLTRDSNHFTPYSTTGQPLHIKP